jgi:hypothetical protein
MNSKKQVTKRINQRSHNTRMEDILTSRMGLGTQKEAKPMEES